MAIGYTNRGSESIRAGTFRQMRPKFGFAILYTMLLPQYLRMLSAVELFADCLRSRRSELSGAERSDLNQEQQRTILRRIRSASDACFPYWPMESMSSKAISPRNEPVSGRRYILEVSVKNDCRWRRGWNWKWRIRNGEKIPTGGTRTATSHTSLYIHEKCAEVVIGKRIPWLIYPSRRTERDMLTHIPLTYTHPGDFFLFLIFISLSAIYFF